MTTYAHLMGNFDGPVSANSLLEQVRAELNELEDYYDERAGWQNHRKAVVGKRLSAFVHGRNIYSQTSAPWRVAVRVDGQYTDYAMHHLYNRYDAEKLVAEFNALNAIGLEA